jgi:peptide/nickel transport system substrate-binding protein
MSVDSRTPERSGSPTAPRRVGAIIFALSLVLAACGGGQAPAALRPISAGDRETDPGPDIRVGGALAVAVYGSSDGWNPWFNQWSDKSTMVGSSVIESLFVGGPGGEPLPWLAESATPNDDATIWRIKVRSGVRFHDGSTLDANAVALNLRTSFAPPALASIELSRLYKSVEVIDPTTVEVQLTQPYPAYPTSLISASWMCAPSMLTAPGGGSDHPVGTGPFVFESDTGGLFQANHSPDYWRKDDAGRALPYLDRISFRVIADPLDQIDALENGSVSLVYSSSAALPLRGDGTFTTIENYSTEQSMIVLNTEPFVDGHPNPLHDRHFRRALALAIDRQSVAAVAGDGVETTTQPFSPGSYYALPEDDDGYPAHDPEEARRELDLYRQTNGDAMPVVEILGVDNSDVIAVLHAVQEQWSAVGIDSRITTVDEGAQLGRIVTGQYQAGFYRNYSFSDPDAIYSFWTADNIGAVSINLSRFTTPSLEFALRSMRASTDAESRRTAFQAGLREFNDNAANLWLFDTPYSLVARPFVRGLNGFRDTPFANFDPKTQWASVWVASQQ